MATPSHTHDTALVAEPNDALAMLTADHRHVETLFAAYDHASDFVTKAQSAALVFAALDVHTHLEEEVFYPAYETSTGKNGTQLVADSRLDHEHVKELTVEMQTQDLTEQDFEMKFQELMQTVQEHVAKEENALFPEAEQMLADQLHDLMTQMVDLQQQLTTAPTPEAHTL